MAHEWFIGPAQALITWAFPLWVVCIPAMLRMDTQRHTGKPTQGNYFQSGQIATVHHVGLDRAQQLVDLWVQCHGVARRFVQLNETHALLGNPVLEVPDSGQ